MQRREQYFPFNHPGLGIESLPNQMVVHVRRYLMAATHVMDLDEHSRALYLDVGCGSGYGTELLGSMYKESVGYDTSEEAHLYAMDYHRKAGTVYTKDMDDVLSMKGLDFTTMIEFIEHVSERDAEEWIEVVASRTKPQGRMFLSTPVSRTKDGRNPMNPWHVHEYQPGEIKELLLRHWKHVGIFNEAATMYLICEEPREVPLA